VARIKGTVFDWLIRLVSHDRTQMQFEWEEEGKALLLGKPMPVILAGNINTGGTIQPNSATGTVPVTEASAANIYSTCSSTTAYLLAGLPLTWTAAGAAVTTYPAWYPRTPVVITADGAGAIAAAVQVTAAGAAGKKKDAVWTCYVSVSGLYKLDFIENTAAAAVTTPDYHTAPVSAYLVAGYPHEFRIENVTAATNMGMNAAANGSWPNGAVMTIVGMDRSV